MNNDWSIKAEEEAKRERNWDPVKRWQAIQETIAWVEAQAKEPRNSKANRLREHAEKERLLRDDPTSSC